MTEKPEITYLKKMHPPTRAPATSPLEDVAQLRSAATIVPV